MNPILPKRPRQQLAPKLHGRLKEQVLRRVNGGHLQTFCQQVSARGETKGLTATSATAGPNLRSLEHVHEVVD